MLLTGISRRRSGLAETAWASAREALATASDRNWLWFLRCPPTPDQPLRQTPKLKSNRSRPGPSELSTSITNRKLKVNELISSHDFFYWWNIEKLTPVLRSTLNQFGTYTVLLLRLNSSSRSMGPKSLTLTAFNASYTATLFSVSLVRTDRLSFRIRKWRMEGPPRMTRSAEEVLWFRLGSLADTSRCRLFNGYKTIIKPCAIKVLLENGLQYNSKVSLRIVWWRIRL